MPQEIGFAAAYEAYRQFKYSTSVYNHLYTDYERQHDVLRALAIAEGMSLSIVTFSLTLTCLPPYQASRLWQDSGRGIDQYGLQMACDAAAATAGQITSEREMTDGYGMGLGAGSFRDRRNSFGAFSGSGYAGSGYAGSGYAGSGYGGGSVYGGSSPLQIAGTLPASPMGSPMALSGSPYGGYAGLPASYGGGYAGSYSSYGTPGYDNYLGLPNVGGYPMSAPGTPMIIHQPSEGHHRRHRHRHHHHHRRHRSHDRY